MEFGKKKHKLLKTVLIGLFIALTIPGIIMVITIAYAFYALNQNNNKLAELAQQKQAQLNSIVVISGQNTDAQGSEGGDGLTGNEDTVSANAQFTVDASFLNTLRDVDGNLKKVNYSRDDEYFETGNSTFNKIIFKYTNPESSDNIFVHFKFSEYFECPDKILCNNRLYSTNKSATYFDYLTLSSKIIERVYVKMGQNTYPY